MKSKLSPAQRRKDAIERRFPSWYLTGEMTSPALHITAAFRSIAELATLRAYIMRGNISPAMCLLLRQSALRSARFNLWVGRRSSPLP
ncbi:hypothetical protein HJB99_07720 [Rhizobium sp. NLR17b]|uniref:hypothetical protein n=1 Tax=Rhizobium sp. NLR17b TaxID=2731114 RepID=UPI001C82AE17|nr:hypothetical protein [Rhizobium sp. NLR17b]MBX5268565.1 hypothetical protein [Rhizobium sp. NLR17b]